MRFSEILMIMIFSSFSMNLSLHQSRILFNTTLNNMHKRINSKNEYDYRFKIFCQNLKEIQHESHQFDKNLFGKHHKHSNNSVDHLKDKSITSYEIAVNKFSLLTDKEFDNIYLMKPKALTYDMSYISKRKNYKYSFKYFKQLYSKYENTFNHIENMANSIDCNYFLKYNFN